MSLQDLKYVVCIEYITLSGGKAISRSKPTTRKSANRKKREFIALKKGIRVWIEKKEFVLTNDYRLLTGGKKFR